VSASIDCFVARVEKFHASYGGVQFVESFCIVYQSRPLRTGWHDLIAEKAGEDSKRRIEGCRFTL
jgi:hypothetical protein